MCEASVKKPLRGGVGETNSGRLAPLPEGGYRTKRGERAAETDKNHEGGGRERKNESVGNESAQVEKAAQRVSKTSKIRNGEEKILTIR